MWKPRIHFNFALIKQLDNQVQFEWLVPQNLPCFEGHFPGNPILPAVAIIDATVHAINVLFQTSIQLLGVSHAKFSGIIKPGDLIKIEITKESEIVWNAVWNKIQSEGASAKMAELSVEMG